MPGSQIGHFILVLANLIMTVPYNMEYIIHYTYIALYCILCGGYDIHLTK